MTGKERGLAALRGEPHDRPPVIPIVGQAGGTLCGRTIYEHAHDPQLLAECQIECARRFGFDGIYIAADTWVNAEAIGFPSVEHPPDQPAGGRGTWIESIEHIESLELPDPLTSGRWPLMVEAVRIASEMVGDELLIVANFDQSPFSAACQLRDIGQFMLDVHDDDDLVHPLLDYCARAVSKYAIAMAEAGAHVLNTGDSSAGGSLIGGIHYERLAFPYEKKVFEEIRRHVDVPISLHICGDSRTCIEKMVQTGADAIEIDEFMDVGIARQHCGDDVTVIGNIDPVDPLLRGTPEEVKTKCIKCLEEFEDSNRFILSSGCAISPENPPETLAAMGEAVDDYVGSASR